MLFPRQAIPPPHVAPARILEYDVFDVDAPDGDFARALWRLRASGAPDLFWTPRNGGHWVATEAGLIEAVLSDPKRFSSAAMRVPKPSNPSPPMIPLMIDPPQHLKYRILLMGAMTPAAVKRMLPGIRELTVSLVEALAPAGGCDFMAAFAQQMPIAVFLSLVGLPAEDRPALMRIVARITRPARPEERMEGFDALAAFMMAKVADCRARPGDGVIDGLLRAEVDAMSLDDPTLQGMLTVLMLAGLDTVAGMLGFIAAHLARHPEHRRRLRQQPAIIPAAVEELLRRMAMVNLTREVAADTELGGTALRAGELVVAPLALVNLAEGRFEDPLRVDLDRGRPRHATFGIGPHVCMGAALARAEIAVFLEEWLPRIPEFAIAEDAVLSVQVGAAATMPSLPLVWDAGPAR